MDGEFDYIIVGAGTAGCILANRLSANPSTRVLLLEAGGNDSWVWFHVPVGYIYAIGNPRADWMFRTEAEPGLNGRTIAYPRGKVIGGSSSINAMIAMRGQAADYDSWSDLGLARWGWGDVLPVFKRLEDHFLGESAIHGIGGGMRIEAPRTSWPVLDAVRDAALEMGIPRRDDFSAGENEGAGYFHVTQKRGRRWSAARGFLKPILGRRNLKVETGVMVDKLMLSGRRADSVIVRRKDGTCHTAKARREVILSAGAIGSIQVLHRSGIGPGGWLKQAGIEVAVDHPGVGRNLQDHMQQRAMYRIKGAQTLNDIVHSPLRKALMGLDYLVRRRGPLTMAPSQLGIFTKSDPSQSRANIEFHVQPLSLDWFGQPLHRFSAITLSTCNLRPGSRGFVRVPSTDLDTPPMIQPNYLSTDEDRKVAVDAMRLTRRLAKQRALAHLEPQEFMPGPAVGDDNAELIKAVGDIGTTIFHPVGTAKMGLATDRHAVVDALLRCIGVEGLRIIDASIMPLITSGNTNIPTAMIAMKGADMILAGTET